MSGPTANDYFAAASYYHDSGKDLDKAYEWVSEAVKMAGDDAYWMLRKKSLIEAEMGKKDAAIATAKRSLAAAKKSRQSRLCENERRFPERMGSEIKRPHLRPFNIVNQSFPEYCPRD